MSNEGKNKLMELYGMDASEQLMKEIKELAKKSNISFKDDKFLKLGLEFLVVNLNEILEGKQKFCDLRALVSKSFGDAATYKYNVCGGKIN